MSISVPAGPLSDQAVLWLHLAASISLHLAANMHGSTREWRGQRQAEAGVARMPAGLAPGLVRLPSRCRVGRAEWIPGHSTLMARPQAHASSLANLRSLRK